MTIRKASSCEHQQPKRLLLCLYQSDSTIKSGDDYFQEFISLAKTLHLSYDETQFMKIRSVDKANFLTKGKLEEVLALCQQQGIEEVVCSVPLTSLQERNLENVLGCRVVDRALVILEIFRQAAHTAEGKIQVEMAYIDYLKTRMAGKGKEFAQQEGGYVGARGPGETAKEKLKRFFADRLRQARKNLEGLKKSRETQRKRRVLGDIPLVCLVGYTNAGKSSLLNIMTKSDAVVADKLFATLDTTTRELVFPNKKKILISDTVGFISELPHHLIEAFQATLEELTYASLLLHVIDVSNHAWRDHVNVVKQTLADLHVAAPILFVFNKVDLLSKQERDRLQLELVKEYQPYVCTHTKDKQGIEQLIDFLRTHVFLKSLDKGNAQENKAVGE